MSQSADADRRSPRGPAALAGLVLVRLIVPAWILAGAWFKLDAASPRLLPKNILKGADALDVDLFWLLTVILAVEVGIAAAILFVRTIARPLAALILAAFCAVLIGEIAVGNTSCGCLGANSPSPWVMLGIDGAMLLGVLLLKPAPWSFGLGFGPQAGLASLALVAGFAVSCEKLEPGKTPVATDQGGESSTPVPPATGIAGTDPGTGTGGAAGTTPPPTPPADGDVPVSPATPAVASDGTIANPSPKPLEQYWFSSNLDAWIGQDWREVPLLQYMRRWPAGLDEGVHYVVFYSRTCEHCEEMFHADLTRPDVGSRTIAIEIPQSATVLTDPNAWAMPATDARLMSLPVGSDWIITAPLALRIEDGTVTYAEEGDHKAAFELD